MRARSWLFVVGLILWAFPLAAQTRTVRGTVVDSASGNPITGANVVVRGTTLGTTTDAQGRFTQAGVPAGDVTITVRRFGYRFRNILLRAGDEEIRVALASDPLQLDEVVVTGQATAVERRNLPNAVATVSAS